MGLCVVEPAVELYERIGIELGALERAFAVLFGL